MDRNTIIGILLIGAILIGYSVFTKPQRERMKEQVQRQQDSLELVRQLDSLKTLQGNQGQPGPQAQQATGAGQAATTTNPAATAQGNTPAEGGNPDAGDLASLYGVFGNAAAGTEEFITVETDLLKVVISNKGGRIRSVELKKYKTYDGKPLVLFEGDSTVFGLNFFAANRSINTGDLYFVPNTESKHIDAGRSERTVQMRLPAGEDSYIQYAYTFTPGTYMVGFDLSFHNTEKIIAGNTTFIDLNWEYYAEGHEKGRLTELNYTNIFYKHFEDEVDHFNPRSKKDLQSEDITTRLKWIGFKQHFFSSVLIAGNNFNNATLSLRKFGENDPYLKEFTAQIGLAYEPESSYDLPMRFYFGPNHYQTLKKNGMEMEDLVSLGGFFSRVFNRYLIIPIFNWLNRFIGSYGLIILVLTIIIKVSLFPLTFRSYLSMAKMRVLKPEIDEINARIPKDKNMERQQATMALYKKAGVSPLGGCLPMVLQMPILIAMFRFFPTSIELRQQHFLWATDLSTYDSILQLPFSIPMYGDHVSLFTLLMTASTILTMRISNQAGAQQSQMPGMKGMMYIMPVMFMFILNNYSSALTYYYFLANIITFAQNQIFKQFVDEDKLRQKIQANKKKGGGAKKSKFQKRMEVMAKQRGMQVPKRK